MLKLLTFLLSLSPLGYLAYLALIQNLGADPGKEVVIYLGEWSMRFLLFVLALSPARELFGWRWPVRIRRMMGLFAFGYVSLHLLGYVLLLLEVDLGELGVAISDRPYITLGFAAWLLMLPLAVTSFNGAVRRLGTRWKQLHRLVYLALILAILHLIWLSKSSYLEAFVYGAIGVSLLLYRVFGVPGFLFQKAIKN